MKKTKRRIKWKNLVIIFFFLVNFFLISITFTNIIFSFINNNNSKKNEAKIQDIAEVIIVEDSENVEIINNEENKSSPYWDYIKMNLIDVDFSELKKINSSTVGWIQVNGTNINYPFVQTDNNDFYLKHSFDMSYNEAGWLFLDFRNNFLNNRNSIIYGHSMNNKTMFGSLKNILRSDWLNNIDNHIIKISTETENSLWQVFSVYHIPTTTDYLQTEFISDNAYLNFLNILKDRSAFIFNTSISEKDKILTLSTCYTDSEKIVMHAKLIKREIK